MSATPSETADATTVSEPTPKSKVVTLVSEIMQEISVKSVREDVQDKIRKARSTMEEWGKNPSMSDINWDKFNNVMSMLDGFLDRASPTSIIKDNQEHITDGEITVVRTTLEFCSFLLTQMVEDP